MVPVHMAQDDIVDILMREAALGKRRQHIGLRGKRLAIRNVVLDGDGIGFDFAAEAEVEEDTGCLVGDGGVVLDEERQRGDGADGGGVAGVDEEAFGDREVASGEGVDGYGGLLGLGSFEWGRGHGKLGAFGVDGRALGEHGRETAMDLFVTRVFIDAIKALMTKPAFHDERGQRYREVIGRLLVAAQCKVRPCG